MNTENHTHPPLTQTPDVSGARPGVGHDDHKREARRTAVAVFLGVVIVSFCWHWVAGTRESVTELFGKAAGIAAFVYIFNRKDWFD